MKNCGNPEMEKSQLKVGDLVALKTPVLQRSSPSTVGIVIEIHPDMGFGDSCRVFWDSGFVCAELLRSLKKMS